MSLRFGCSEDNERVVTAPSTSQAAFLVAELERV